MRVLLTALLLGEAFFTAAWLTRLLAMLPVYGWATLGLVAARAGVATLQLMGGLTLRRGGRAGAVLARWAWLASAAMLTIELSARLTPTNVFPAHRPVVIAAYWAYALISVWALTLVGPGADARRSGH